ncbi:hypothetical protein BU089_05850 [Staphylococcus warneri]|nr:hypothetical protein BU089_05850 [Staphylococcus warneri]
MDSEKDKKYKGVCGHTETRAQMNKLMKKKTSGKVSKKEKKKYMNQQEELDNNPFKDALKNLKL